MERNIYTMSLHQLYDYFDDNGDPSFSVLRVPGGWIYSVFSVFDPVEESDPVMSSVFVPYKPWLEI